jgi:hypothetical protein
MDRSLRDDPAVMLDWKQLAELGPIELQTALLAESDQAMNGLSEAEQDRVLERLPEPLRAMWLINWLGFEVSQGSLLAYFYNTSGRHAALAEDLLRRMGATQMADVLGQALASQSRVSEEWATQRVELDQLPEFAITHPYSGLSNAETLSALTDRYWQAAEADNWGDKFDAYLAEEVAALAAR